MGGEDFDELAEGGREDVPGVADMAVEGEGLVLGEDEDAAEPGVDAIGEGDVDQAVDAAKGNHGLGVVRREGK
jgi:hypothetical protein